MFRFQLVCPNCSANTQPMATFEVKRGFQSNPFSKTTQPNTFDSMAFDVIVGAGSTLELHLNMKQLFASIQPGFAQELMN